MATCVAIGVPVAASVGACSLATPPDAFRVGGAYPRATPPRYTCAATLTCAMTVGDGAIVTCDDGATCNITCTAACSLRCSPSADCRVKCVTDGAYVAHSLGDHQLDCTPLASRP